MKISKNKKEIFNKKRGFALLFSILVAVLVVSLGASIVSISLRQIILSGTSRESQLAFYAANTGVDCAFFWDLNTPPGAVGNEVTFPFGSETRIFDPTGLTCSGINIASNGAASAQTVEGAAFISGVNGGSWDIGTPNKTVFRFEITNSISSDVLCAQVTVNKIAGAGSTIITTIESKGYNKCDLNDSKAVERGIILKYTT